MRFVDVDGRVPATAIQNWAKRSSRGKYFNGRDRGQGGPRISGRGRGYERAAEVPELRGVVRDYESV